MVNRKRIVYGLLIMLLTYGGCGESVYMEKIYEAESALHADDQGDAAPGIGDSQGADGTSTAENSRSTEHLPGTEEQETLKQEPLEETEKAQEEKTLVIYICGAVAKPGVYELPEEARVVHAIEAAGGLREDADTVTVNQAKRLEDGEQIRILTKEEAEAVKSDTKIEGMEASGESGKVNINQADMAELMTLPGIGQAKAKAIIEFRETNGRFTSITDIMKISGIKESVFSKIEDLITV